MPEEQAEAEAEQDYGPILPGRGATDYERYLRTDELLSLQREPSERVHRDELLFQTVHQSSELWLKLACAEIADAAQLVDSDELGEGARLVRRAVLCMRHVIEALEMLDRLDPWDYLHIRTALGHGAGFDSPGFRQVARVTPRLSGAFDRALERAGVSLEELYTRPRGDERRVRLHELAEALTDWDERIWTWRFRHYSIVARQIGEDSIGTQGTPVQVLGRLIAQRQVPRLWQVRSRLVELFDAERAAAHGGGHAAE